MDYLKIQKIDMRRDANAPPAESEHQIKFESQMQHTGQEFRH